MEKQKKDLARWQKTGDNTPDWEKYDKRVRKNGNVIFMFKLVADEKNKIYWKIRETFYSGYCREDVIYEKCLKERGPEVLQRR